MSKVTPFLMFNDQLESAIEFYTSTFPDSRVTNVARAERGGAFPRWPDPFARPFAVRSEHDRGDVLAPCPHPPHETCSSRDQCPDTRGRSEVTEWD